MTAIPVIVSVIMVMYDCVILVTVSVLVNNHIHFRNVILGIESDIMVMHCCIILANVPVSVVIYRYIISMIYWLWHQPLWKSTSSDTGLSISYFDNVKYEILVIVSANMVIYG